MDELEISGRRYISTRRAAREHGYHSDYMGQLIRGKKVVGQKVGRAWYIEEESLSSYLGKAPAPAPTAKAATAEAPVLAPIERLVIEEPAPAAVPEPVVPVATEIIKEEQSVAVHVESQPAAEPVAVNAAPQPVAEPVAVREFVQEINHAPIHTEEERRIPIHTPAPAAHPMGGLRYAEDTTPSIPVVTRAPSVQTMPEAHSLAASYGYAPAKESSGTFPFIGLSIVGIMAILATAFASNFVTATVVSEQGKAATVQYAIHW